MTDATRASHDANIARQRRVWTKRTRSGDHGAQNNPGLVKVVARVLAENPDANAILRWNRIYLREDIGVFFQVEMKDPKTGDTLKLPHSTLEARYLLPVGANIVVQDGDTIDAGDVLIDQQSGRCGSREGLFGYAG